MNARTRGRAVVTGASSGIGEAFARALARRGHPLLLVARRRERLDALAAELAPGLAARARNGAAVDPIVVATADLGDDAQVADVAARALALGDVELLVNNAGFATRGEFAELDGEREERMVKLNVLAPLTLTHRLLPSLIARGQGGIINVASIGAFQPVPFMATYGATKAFVLSWSEALSEELRGSGVRVLCVCPGPTASEFFDVASMPEMRRVPHLMSTDELVARSLDAFDDGRAVLTPGLINWLGAFAVRLVPRMVTRVVTARMFAPRTPRSLPPPSSPPP
jgi:short-subunit dehydrogenase